MKAYLKVIAILAVPLAFILFYAYSPMQLPPPGWKLAKLPVGSKTEQPEPQQEAPDTIAPTSEPHSTGTDTAAQRILFFGDSMVEGLMRRMSSYAHANGHNLTNVVWYGSTTEIWAQTDTLRHFLELVQPSFVMVCIGANEQFIKEVDERALCIKLIMREIGRRPFVWIGSPAWKEDTGINSLTQSIVGKERYYDSRRLTLTRGSDHRHPTFSAASVWMDSVALWMGGKQTAHPIRMAQPADSASHHSRTYTLQPIPW